MGQIQWTISLVMLGLFVVAILGFTLGFGNDNQAPINIGEDPEFADFYNSAGSNLSGFSGNSEDTYNSIVNTTIASSSASGTTQTAGQFSITTGDLIGITKNILQTGYVRIFGTGSGFGIFMTTLLSMIVFITGLLIWKTWAGRSPE